VIGPPEIKKFDGISLFDTIHQHDGQTDSKDRAMHIASRVNSE